MLLNEPFSDAVPLKDRTTNLSDTGEIPVIVPQVILVTVRCLRRNPISLFQTQASGNPCLFHSLHNSGSTGIVLKGKGRE